MEDVSSQVAMDVVDNTAKERVFTQSELNEIVGRAKREAAESVRRQAQQSSPAPQQQVQQGFSEEHVRKLASEELMRQRQAWEQDMREKADAESARRVVESYKAKIAAGKQDYEDFDAVTHGLRMGSLPNVVQLLADHAENASGVLYELAKNRAKLHAIETMADKNPEDAIYELKRLEKSIKANSEASTQKQARSPLAQQKASSTSGLDSGKALSVSDYKKMFRA